MNYAGLHHRFLCLTFINNFWHLFRMIRRFGSKGVWHPQISNRGRYSISNINHQLTICLQMLKFGASIFFFFCNVLNKIGAFIVYFLSFNLADLYWPKEQSISIRYLVWHPLFLRFYFTFWNPCFAFLLL